MDESARDRILAAKRPIVFFDDDADGVASFLVTQRVLGRTFYAPVKKRPNLGETLAGIATQLGADLKVVLDVAELDDAFLSAPPHTVWIDHHDAQDPRGAVYLNPKAAGGEPVPTSVLVRALLGGPAWIAAVGSVADYFVPDFLGEVREAYPELVPDFATVEDLVFSSPLGELALIFETCVKGTVPEARRKLDLLRAIVEPSDLLEGSSPAGARIRRAYLADRELYDGFLAEALAKDADGPLFVFTYAHGGHTFTAQLSNELAYRMPGRVVLVASEYAGAYRCSLRSQSVELPGLLREALEGVDGAGGGHPHACGAHVATADFERFCERLRSLLA